MNFLPVAILAVMAPGALLPCYLQGADFDNLGLNVLHLACGGVLMTKGGTTRILKSDSGEATAYLRVFVAESSASDLFWLEMVFKSSHLPYWIEVVTTVPAAMQYLERNEIQSDLILSDTVELLDHLAASGNIPAFLLTNTPGTDVGDRVIEKPFTRQKLLNCLSAAGLDSWAARLSGSEHANAA